MLASKSVIKDLEKLGTFEKARASAWFFKTGKGQYGYGDIFFGVTVPEQRKIAKKYADLPLNEISKLLKNRIHECRFTGLLILVGQYRRADLLGKKLIVKFYLSHSKCVNNWDLVDSSAPYVLGDYLFKLGKKDRKLLYKLAVSENLWHRRIAILATFAFIKNGEFEDSLKISKILINDRHDLIHKAVGWSLREVGNKSKSTEKKFLDRYVSIMPRTMLRYAIEKFSQSERKKYLSL